MIVKQGVEIDEYELAVRCSKGDSSACKELYTRYAARVTYLCSRYAMGPEEAEDLMHDSMIAVFRSIGRFKFRGKGSLNAWISRVAVNTAIDRYRKAVRQEVSAESMAAEPAETGDITAEDAMRVPLEVLEKMISLLPDTKRFIFNMFCIEGLSHKEIAGMLGITEKTSSSLLSKARRMLSERIREYYSKTMEDE